ncbi:MAG: hypothetical protein WCH85_06900 [Methanomicrobiales archaeon]
MKNPVRLSPIERAAKSLMEAKGYAVVPMRPCFPTRHKPAHLMAFKSTTGLYYLKLKATTQPLNGIPAASELCNHDARLLRRLFPHRITTPVLHLQIWIQDNTGRFTCLEVLAESLREVSHA